MNDGAAETPEVRQIPPPTPGRAGSGGRAPGWSRWLRGSARRLLAGGVDLLFPPRCPICRREHAADQMEHQETARRENVAPGPDVSAGAPPAWSARVCGPCERELATDAARCPHCGRLASSPDRCRECRRRPAAWRRIVVLSGYEGVLRDAVLRAKRPSGEDVAAALATLLVHKHRAVLDDWGIDLVVPVPMHWLRRSLRGTSAADEIAARVAAGLRRPWARSLTRRKATRMQNSLPPCDRAANVAGAFACRRTVTGARILLVDDVLTTGATVADCCRALREGGAASVDVAVVARADSGADAVD